MWKKNVKDIDGDVLCVSQFTLFASTTKGKPDFHRAMVCSVSSRILRPPLPADLPRAVGAAPYCTFLPGNRALPGLVWLFPEKDGRNV